MKSLPWFRMYHEARTDRKLQRLTDRQHRIWFHLLCFSAEQDGRGTIAPIADYLLAIECGCEVEELEETISLLTQLHIMSRDVTPSHGDTNLIGVTFIHFEDRQYDKPSDTPERTRERKARQRAKGRDIPHESRDVTPSHAQDKKRIEKNREDISPQPPKGQRDLEGFEEWYAKYPRKAKRQDAERAWSKLSPNDREAAMTGLDAWFAAGLFKPPANGEDYRPYSASWLNGRRWEDEAPAPTPHDLGLDFSNFGSASRKQAAEALRTS